MILSLVHTFEGELCVCVCVCVCVCALMHTLKADSFKLNVVKVTPAMF